MNGSKILIAGGGIGGLTTALSLYKAGFDVTVYESSKEIGPLGVGINLLPHAVRVLANLGLQELLSDVAVATSELVYFNKFGQKIWGESRGKFAGYHWPQFSVHRGIFQMLLLAKVREAIGEERIYMGHHLKFCESKEHGVSATFIARHNDEQVINVEGDALVGCDGIHSVVRKQFYPNEGIPKFSGVMLHRGTTLARPFLSASSMIMAGSRSKKFVAYPITPIDERGQQLINWIADLQVGEEGNIMVRDWNRRADKEKLLSQFSAWQFPWLDIPYLISNAQEIYEFPMSDRDPLPQWSFDRITLLGDAAHPMYPIGSNGASQAILDAECLTGCLLHHEDAAAALKEYEAIRLPATANIVLQNRKMGPEEVMQIVEERAPNGFDHLHDVISQEELEAIAAQYKKIAGFEKEILNQKQ
jgi:2-polyprenyl-6-methoxyphenol hydroxylase-like FAD-dependent oxidoreductase